MKLFKTTRGIVLLKKNAYHLISEEWDGFVNQENLYTHLQTIHSGTISAEEAHALINGHLQAPIGRQELWAAGVTYLRSRDARMDESKDSGGADFYQKVYEAERPELFFKALPHRISAHQEEVYIRKDSAWNVPEPELTLYINSKGNIQGYTIGNDMSSRDIEGENPLYLPQAKVYERSAALGPCLFVPALPISTDTEIRIRIVRDSKDVFHEHIQLNRMKRGLPELASWLYRGCDFKFGCYLMTGTGMVPPSEFTLKPGDTVHISIEGIGELINTVAVR